MPPDDDIPAAHSMDTRWFAVDVEGNVGLFDTGEDGAIPERAGNLGGPSDASFDALLFYASLAARRIHAGTWKPPHDTAWLDGLKAPQRVMVVLEAAPSDPAEFELLSIAPWMGLSKKELKPARLRELATWPGLVAMVTARMLYDLLDPSEEENSEMFVFLRDHGDQPGQYKRVAAPEKSLKLDELPPPAREAIGALTVPVAFSASETFHLGDHLADNEAQYYRDGWTLRSFGPDENEIVNKLPRRQRSKAGPIIRAAIILLVTLVAWLLARKFSRH